MASAAYERRIASYLRRHPGATRQDARGHRAATRPAGTTEHGERARKTRRKYGVAPSTLTKLRRDALRHVKQILGQTTTKSPVFDETIQRYHKHMSADWLRDVLAMSAREYQDAAAGAATETAPDEPKPFNPFWYHSAY